MDNMGRSESVYFFNWKRFTYITYNILLAAASADDSNNDSDISAVFVRVKFWWHYIYTFGVIFTTVWIIMRAYVAYVSYVYRGVLYIWVINVFHEKWARINRVSSTYETIEYDFVVANTEKREHIS